MNNDVSFNVLLIPEDPVKDGYVLKPIIEAMMRAAGKPQARVDVCDDPRFRGTSQGASLTTPQDFETSGIRQTPSAEFRSKAVDVSARSPKKPHRAQEKPSGPTFVVVATPDFPSLVGAFPLSWSHYVRLMSVGKPHARTFYEAEAIRGGWSVRQLARQIGTQFFERVSASKRQEAMLSRGRKPKPEDAVLARDEVHGPSPLKVV